MHKLQTMKPLGGGCVFLCMFALIIHPTSGLEFRIAEELPAGTEVGRITLSNHQRLLLTNHQDLFQVEAETGRVFTRRKLDRETLGKDFFELIVVDQHNTNLPHSVKVFLEDINDNVPKFPEAVVSITFLETDQISQQYLLDTAVDADGGANGIIRQYAIVSGNDEGRFRLRLTQASADISKNHFLHIENTGILDRETRDNYVLNISASDGGTPSLTGYFELNITIGDDNDNRPVFTPSEYVAAVSENAPAGSIVLKVHADDYDSGLNSLISYSLANDTQFSIDEKTGVIRTTRNQTHCLRVKCDQSDCPRTCVLTVTAQDHGGLTGRARIFVSLLDENDHAPEITFRYYPSASPYATVAEDAPNGTIVAVVNVKDLDDGLNGKVDTFITNGNADHQFRLESASMSSQGSLLSSMARMQLAYLKVNGQFDRQRLNSYNLTITAVDNGHPSLNSSQSLMVHVNPLNRYSPVFQSAKYESPLNEDVPVGSYVHTVRAVDEDEGINGKILYSIVAGNDLSWFAINQDTGLVTTDQALSRQKTGSSVHLNISARDAAPSPRIAYTTLMVSIEDVNDHKPRFTNCPEEVNLRENVPLGTLVHHFMAVDEDFGENGLVSFELSLSSSASFSIDHKTGQLITSGQLDRETQPAHNLMVIARDNASHQSQSSSSCLVTVRLTDEKDTRPQFYPVYYMVPVQNKLTAGQTLTQVKATDADRNDLIRYALAYTSHNGIRVHERTGQVSTTMPLSIAPGDLAKIQITVTDAFGLTAQPSATLYLFSSESSDSAEFKFESKNPYSFAVKENSANLTVGTVRLRNLDKWNKVEYFITDGDMNGIFSYDGKTGILRTERPLDREETASYHLKLSAWMSPYYASTSIDIAVIDEADSTPVITSFEDVKIAKMDIPCSWPLGQAILTIEASDADMGVNAQLVFTLLHNDATSPFSVNSSTGVITLVRPVNCHNRTTISTTVIVTDGAGQSSSKELHFRVVPDASCRIFFERKHVVISVSEDRLVNSRLLTLDVKQCESPVRYSIAQGNEAGRFAVFPNGQLYINATLNRRHTAYYRLGVTATDQLHIASTTVTIYVTAANRHSPVFLNHTYTFLLPSNLPVGGSVGRVEAEDQDLALNGEVLYSLAGNTDGPFSVDENSGVVRLMTKLSKEELQELKRGSSLKVVATDRAAEGQARRSATATVKILPGNASNGSWPVFAQQVYEQSISENMPTGQLVTHVAVQDVDAFVKGQIAYSIQCPSCAEVFTVDEMTGVIRLNQTLDYETRSRYDLLVLATDRSVNHTSHKTSSAVCIVHVTNENDEAPRFQVDSYSVKVRENSPAGTMVIQTLAMDGDSMQTELGYEIIDGNSDKIFRISRFGQIYLVYSLDYEKTKSHGLTVKAFEIDEPDHFSTVCVLVEVEDCNDHAPLFSAFTKSTIRVPENTAPGSVIATTLAHDQDTGINGEIRYSILYAEPVNGHFSINEVTGQIMTSMALDREVYRSYRLVLQAVDQAEDHNSRQSSEKAITIELLDNNDNSPFFVMPRSVIVTEYANSGYRLLTVAAQDPDHESNGHVTYDLTRTADMERFHLDRYDGHVYLRSAVDQIAPHYTLSILARDQSDDGSKQSATMNVDLVIASRVEGENALVFGQTAYEWTVHENIPVGSHVGTVSASLSTNTIQPVEYFLTLVTGQNGDVLPCPFDIDIHSGAISLRGPALDADQGPDEYLIQVYAGIKRRTSFQVTAGQVRLKVLSVNDKPPLFTSPFYRFHLETSAPPGARLGQVAATDLDKADMVTFSLPPPNITKFFTISESTGELFLKSHPGNVSRVCFDVIADDSVHQTKVPCCIDVENPFRLTPQFAKGRYAFTVVLDGMEDGEQIGSITATGGAETYEYYQSNEWHNNNFHVDRRTGDVFLAHPRAYRAAQNQKIIVVLRVSSSPVKQPLMSNSTLVFITLLRSNYTRQTFPSTTTSVSEDAPIATCFHDLSDLRMAATDKGGVWAVYGDALGWFTISSTGLLCTAAKLDRETSTSLRLTAVFRSGIFTTTQHFDVVIEDVNDEAPVFDKNLPKLVEISSDLAIGAEVLHVHARDRDSGMGGEIQYSLTPTENQFSIDPFTGVVRLNENLKVERKSRFDLILVAQDKGSPSLSSTSSCTVLVRRANYNAPKFSASQYVFDIPEETVIGQKIASLSAIDPDSGVNGDLRYWILSGNQEETFELDMATGHLYVLRGLEYATRRKFELVVLVEDGGSPSKNDTAVVIINIQNINDEAPHFLVSHYKASVMENFFLHQSSTVIVQVQAAPDADAAPFSRIKYRMRSGDASIFQIGEDDGWIRLLRPLDHEEQSTYQVEIEAANEDFSATSVAFVKVTVGDENDTPPVFLGNLTYMIKENSKIGSLVGYLNATDVDKNTTLRYSLSSTAPFAIDTKSGRIATIASLDREQQSRYELTVRVDDGMHSTIANATVIVLDEDDNFPVFGEKSAGRFVPPTSTTGHFVYGALADDRDEAGSRSIKYRFVGPDSASSWLSIDRTAGVVQVAYPASMPSLPTQFIIQAEDQAGHVTTMSLEIRQKSASLFPAFELNPRTVTLSELSKDGPISQAAADPAQKVSYAIAAGNNEGLFAVNSQSGQVSLVKALDYEAAKNHSLWIEASIKDGDDVVAYGAKLEVLVKNENDNGPQFSSHLYETKMEEETKPAVKLQLGINAVDLDGDKLTYRLLNGTNMFSVDHTTGEMTTTVQLDREVTDVVTVQISVSDGVFTDTAMVTVRLEDKNDNPSKFARQFAANVTENTPVGTFVLQVFSVDTDSPTKTQVTFSMVDKTNLFTIDPSSGIIRLAGLLDREVYSEVPLEVTVSDGAWQSKSQIVVSVVGENDHVPNFEEQQYVFFIQTPETTSISVRPDNLQVYGKARPFSHQPRQTTLVGTVKALDGDEDDKATELVYAMKHPSPYLQVDRSTGQLVLKRTMEMLSVPVDNDIHEFVVVASEVSPMRRSAETTVRIAVLPTNYTAPQLTQAFYALTLSSSDILPNVPVMELPLRQSDPPRVPPKFAVVSTNCSECFALETMTGRIRSNDRIDNCSAPYFCQIKVAAVYTENLTSTPSIVNIRVTKEPSVAPRFADEQYEVQVPESAALGTVLFTAKLDNTDQFLPGQTELSLLNHTNIFQIDPHSGNVKLKKQLDYEESRQYFLTVRARSYSLVGGATTATTQFLVTVLNENDCAPVFVQETFTATVQESEKIGQNMLTVRAVDADAEGNAVYYTIEPESPYFEIDSARGIIINTKELDFETSPNHTLTIRVLDVADPSLYSEAQVVIVVEGVNEYSPVCSSESFIFSVSANAPADTKIGNVVGVDKDEGADGIVMYSLVEEGSAFSIDAASGEIVLSRQLNLQPGSEHRLHLLIRNPNSDQKLAICEVVIHVVDGKNTPHFVQREYYARIKENVRTGSQVVGVDAITELKNRLRYSIRAGDDRGQFSIDSKSGQISTAKLLDRETTAVYKLEVMAFVSDGEKELSSTTIVHITVDDINDNAPYFHPSKPVGHVKENSFYETVVLKLNASDDDVGPSFFSYRLASAEWREYFRVHPSSGVVTALKALDREKDPEVLLKIAVTDNGSPPQTALLDVKIVVDDVNDNPSKARPLTIVVYVEEYVTTRSRRLGSVKPLDADESGSFHCQILSGNRDVFSISGECGLVAFEMDPAELYRLEIEGSDGKHEAVRYEVVIKPEVVTKSQHETSLSVLVSGISTETFMEQHYVRFMQTMYEIFVEKGQVSVIGLTNVGSDCVLQVSVTHKFQQLGRGTIKQELQHRLKDIKRKSGVVISDVDYRPCTYTTCAAPAICRDLVQPVPRESSMVSSSNLIVVSSAFDYSHRCYCPEPFSGPQCETWCRPGYCQNGGTCAGNDVCTCPEGFYGSQCQFDLDECNLWGTPKCLNGGKCVNTFGSFYCEQERTCVGTSCNEKAVKSYGLAAGSFMEVAPVKLENLNIAMVISTRTSDSTVLYSQSVGQNGATSFLSLDIKKGLLYFSFGSSLKDTTRITVNKFISDGYYHHVVITRHDSIGSLSVTDCTDEGCVECHAGDESCSTTAVGMIKQTNLDDTSVLVGNYLKKEETSRYFSGCIRNFTINGGSPQIKHTHEVRENFCPINSGSEISIKAETKLPTSIDNILIAVLVLVLLVLALLAAVLFWRFRKSRLSKKASRATSRLCPPFLSPITFFQQACPSDHYGTQYGSKTRAPSSYNRGSRYGLERDSYCMYHAEQGDDAHYYCVLPDRRDAHPVADRPRPASHYASIDVYGAQHNYVNDAGVLPMIYRPSKRHAMMSPAAISEGSTSTQPVDMCSVASRGSSNCRHETAEIFENSRDDVSDGQCSACENCKLPAHYDMQTWNQIPRYQEPATYAEVEDNLVHAESREGPLRYVMV
ncbi:hypothetical protein RvY_07667 [Ramazzottius varieornatus]|uniref:Uncharacterized protein n=1 Tax=Ramazzottius varieornatus TaxID=947166 RepID=A0A1D1V307_RAMVA|nr:hypothetical protein RvY_07667 [Ramazzottius varieornatus]